MPKLFINLQPRTATLDEWVEIIIKEARSDYLFDDPEFGRITSDQRHKFVKGRIEAMLNKEEVPFYTVTDDEESDE
jgi:hypothetical protein